MMAVTDDPAALDVVTAGHHLRSGALTSVALTEACLAHIASRNDELRAFITVTADSARAAAADADRELAAGHDRGPLHGVPISLKDIIDQQGVPTTAASRVRGYQPAPSDALVTSRLKAAGAVLIGKTNLHEFAFGTTSEVSAFGAVRNPIDVSRSAGGSSGGSAVSVVTGMAIATIGTDTGGSIRVPAAACGIVGLKPGFGEVPRDGVVPLSTTFDHVGPLARSVADAAAVYGVLARRAVRPPAIRPLEGMRLRRLGGYMEALLEPGVRTVYEQTLERLRGGRRHHHDGGASPRRRHRQHLPGHLARRGRGLSRENARAVSGAVRPVGTLARRAGPLHPRRGLPACARGLRSHS